MTNYHVGELTGWGFEKKFIEFHQRVSEIPLPNIEIKTHPEENTEEDYGLDAGDGIIRAAMDQARRERVRASRTIEKRAENYTEEQCAENNTDITAQRSTRKAKAAQLLLNGGPLYFIGVYDPEHNIVGYCVLKRHPDNPFSQLDQFGVTIEPDLSSEETERVAQLLNEGTKRFAAEKGIDQVNYLEGSEHYQDKMPEIVTHHRYVSPGSEGATSAPGMA